eukprot:GHVU01206365.1.p1 GENE.GHVU01206365.1~~GHVU01206365.1.p1  ORF type:complete len:170 (+),score=2.74 GHVU01206365.1:1-510(+)
MKLRTTSVPAAPVQTEIPSWSPTRRSPQHVSYNHCQHAHLMYVSENTFSRCSTDSMSPRIDQNISFVVAAGCRHDQFMLGSNPSPFVVAVRRRAVCHCPSNRCALSLLGWRFLVHVRCHQLFYDSVIVMSRAPSPCLGQCDVPCAQMLGESCCLSAAIVLAPCIIPMLA